MNSWGRSFKSWGRKFQHFLWKHRFLYKTAENLIVGLPPFVVMHFYSVSSFAKELTRVFPIAKILESSPVQWIVFAVIWAWVWHHIIRLVVSWLKDGPSGWENAAPIMLQSLGSVVGRKSTRFLEALSRELQNPSFYGKWVLPEAYG